jgi:hypothetical protein
MTPTATAKNYVRDGYEVLGMAIIITRGFQYNFHFNNGIGNRGFLDVYSPNTFMIYDFKFGSTTMGSSQFLKYSRNFPGFTIQVVRP